MAITEENPGYKWVGTRPIRPDGLDKVTGKAQFGADLTLPGMLFGKVVRSPHAHARILSIDTSAAESMLGVKAVITGSDFPDLVANGAHPMAIDVSHNAIARDKVLYEGHVVAAVAATTRELAEAAAKAVEVSYEVLPHVLTVDEAMADNAPLLHEGMITKGVDPAPDQPSNIASRIVHERGDLEQGFGEAEVVVEREFTTKPVHQGYIEPHAAVADANSDGRANIWCSSQGHFQMRADTASVLGVSQGTLKVTAAEIGGGFGGKTVIYLEPIAVRLSQRAGRPVKLVMDRDEVFRATGPTSGTRIKVKMGVSNDGKLTAAEVWMAFEAGAYAGSPVGAAGMTVIAAYDIPHFLVEGYDVVCNKPRVAAYRAPGAPMAAFAVESVLDELARSIDMDPIDLRLANAAVEGTQASYGPKFPRIGFVETLEAIKEHPNYTAELGPNQGRGVAAGFWFNAGMNSSATVHINENGTATVVTGSPDIGGSRQSMALMAAEELGIPYESIKPVVADTETVGFTDVTGGSRVTLATGAAVVDACRIVIEDLRARAAKTWDVEVDQVEWVDGQAQHVDGSQPPLSLDALAAKSGRTGGPISANASLNARGVGAAFSTQVCDVEVDPETGVTRVVRYLTAQDAGRAISPDYVEGQMQGGVVQGIGWGLNEEYVHDQNGNMENPSFLDYRMPVASDLPMIECCIVEVPNPAHPYGVRGVGEVGIVPPMAALGNAIKDATGVRLTDLPMTPIKVLEALNEQSD
ncbi:MAG: xanthine dehydrogenase family protein molybdopterin-binding subunit [Actinomycetota bacterium]|nr:xanthine dehydrogenase family protein molybdopterin-binding subunit [Acidimicrobiales bacterium]MED5541715.1 xanthine dehydrogenase family protein molybdopterin-binding subunit [Actinomycetota bacterium]MEE2807011.1 xanthine dehydrogenase family protein molybdopterin-binding subunit [Actinomycetota bacterium]|tara:strand:+ start:603 stop:2855 length:2253 start_codon:yes stop_codon:yes gene_type:complete